MMSRRILGACAVLAVAFVGCGGGGGNAAGPITPPITQPHLTGNALTSYSVFTGQVNNEAVIDVEPLGVTSSIPGAKAVFGALAIYPDGSTQSTDISGNFDASQSSWALANLSAVSVDPAMQPLVDVIDATTTGTPALPEEIAVTTYAPGGSIVPLASSPIPDLAAMAMIPKSTWLADGHARLYSVFGRDVNGSPYPLDHAQVVWTLSRASGCGTPAGTIAALASDSSKAIYKAPATGSTTSNCPDQISATVTASGATYSVASTAYSFDPKSGAKLAGVLKDQSGKAVANALIDLYAAAGDADQGALLVRTDGQGHFARTVPSNRILSPVVAVISAGTVSYKAISPASINPASVGSAISNQTWTLGVPTTSMKKARPDFATILRDAANYSDVMREKLPLDIPGTNGAFVAGTIEAILAAPKANLSGTVSAGAYRGFAFTWDATGKIATFQQNASAAEQHVLTVTLGASKVNGAACASGAACFNYTLKYGSALHSDGAWSQQVVSNKYALTYTANIYNSTHQTAGSPLYSDVVTASQALGSSALSFTDARLNTAGKPLATITVSRTPSAAPTLYTYSGSVQRFSYANGKSLEVDYTLGAGSENDDGSGKFTFQVAHTPASADAGVIVTWNASAANAAASNNVRASGAVDAPGETGLTSGHEGSFTLNSKNVIHLTLDPSLGGGQLTIQL